jgi:glutamate-5-semialdehyde dehydrogenase
MHVKTKAAAAKSAASEMGRASAQQKNTALELLIKNVKSEQDTILEANCQDIELAKELKPALLERLSLENRLNGILCDIEKVIQLDDPVGIVEEERVLPNHLHLAKYRVPIGMLGVIYESRPNVTLDICALAIKSGNCALLRGGSETLHTNGALIACIQRALAAAGLPEQALQLIATGERSEVKEMLQLHEYIDLIIPRGSAQLQQFCRTHSTIPVIMGGSGICHLFVDASADLQQALCVIVNAKTQRPTVCNALDTLLLHAAIAPSFLRQVVEALSCEGVHFRVDDLSQKMLQDFPCQRAEAQDWDREWLSLVLGIKVVKDVHKAIAHIRKHSTGHSDGILTECRDTADHFIRAIDSAVVYVNASTRFTDGGQFGMGAEVAISTQKLHARGPMGLRELTSYKWVVRGNYHVRS